MAIRVRVSAALAVLFACCGIAHAATDGTIRQRFVGSWTARKNQPLSNEGIGLLRYYAVLHFDRNGRGGDTVYSGKRCGVVVSASAFTWTVKDGKLLIYPGGGTYLEDNVLRIRRNQIDLYSVEYAYEETRRRVSRCRAPSTSDGRSASRSSTATALVYTR